MSTLKLKVGNAFTQTVQMVFPEGGIDELSNLGLKVAYRALGAGTAAIGMEIGQKISERLHGGMPYPGTLKVYDTHLEFAPAFKALSFLYKGVEKVTLDCADIAEVKYVSRAFVFRSADIFLESGKMVRILATFEAKKIVDAIQDQIR